MSAMALLKWGSTAAQAVGVFALSSRIVSPHVAFAVMSVGSVGWMVAAAGARDWSLCALNAMFTLSNGVGLARWAA